MRGILVKVAIKQVGTRSSRSRLAIVKLGGSHATGPHLNDWLTAIAAEAGPIVIVPGGGPFAERGAYSSGLDRLSRSRGAYYGADGNGAVRLSA